MSRPLTYDEVLRLYACHKAFIAETLEIVEFENVSAEHRTTLLIFIFPLQSVLFHLKCIYRNNFLASVLEVGKAL